MVERFPSLSHGMFMRGPIELVEYYLEKVNKEVSAPMATYRYLGGSVHHYNRLRLDRSMCFTGQWMAVLDERKEELSTSSPRERIRLGIEMRLRSIGKISSQPELPASPSCTIAPCRCVVLPPSAT